MRIKPLCFGVLILFALTQSSVAQKRELPTFEAYVAEVYAGKPAPLNIRSHRLARMYKTSIGEQLQAEGINFAGHYTIAVMGCGTACSITAIVDARNGRAFFPPVLEGWTSEVGDYKFAEDDDIRSFRVNSRLLRIVGRPRQPRAERWGPSGIYYYEWMNNNLRQVHFVPAGFVSKGQFAVLDCKSASIRE